MSKKIEIINAFKTTKENKDYIKKIKESQYYDVPESVIVEDLLSLGIKEHKKVMRNKK